MAKSAKIHVMISSRCKARIRYRDKLVWRTDVRKELENQIKSLVLWEGQESLFECWINEASSGADIRETSWEESIRRDAGALERLSETSRGGDVRQHDWTRRCLAAPYYFRPTLSEFEQPGES